MIPSAMNLEIEVTEEIIVTEIVADADHRADLPAEGEVAIVAVEARVEVGAQPQEKEGVRRGVHIIHVVTGVGAQ